MSKKYASVVRLGWVAFVSFALCFGVLAATSPRKTADTACCPSFSACEETVVVRPNAALSPDQVVRLVLDALRDNDASDSGITTAFAFASPANKTVTGPVERFIPLVKTPTYAPLVNHRSADCGAVTVKDDRAEAVVTVLSEGGEEAIYLFQLSKQADGDLVGCWMTDGVQRLERATPGTGPAQIGTDANSLERA